MLYFDLLPRDLLKDLPSYFYYASVEEVIQCTMVASSCRSKLDEDYGQKIRGGDDLSIHFNSGSRYIWIDAKPPEPKMNPAAVKLVRYNHGQPVQTRTVDEPDFYLVPGERERRLFEIAERNEWLARTKALNLNYTYYSLCEMWRLPALLYCFVPFDIER